MMRCKHVLAAFALLLVFTGKERVPAASIEEATNTPYIEISSIRIEPESIYIKGRPSRAKIIVEVTAHGNLPAVSWAHVDVGSYSGHPATNQVRYDPYYQGVNLDPGKTVITFYVRATKGTVKGSVKIAASVERVAPGINVVNPPADPSHYIASLNILDP